MKHVKNNYTRSGKFAFNACISVRKLIAFISALLLALLTSAPVNSFATSYVWTGATSTAWATPTNWTPNGNPGSAVGDDVSFPVTTRQPLLTVTPANALVSVTFTGASATLTITGATLTVTGAVTLNSDAGTSTACTITGSGTLSCGSVELGSTVTPVLTAYTTKMTSTITAFNIADQITLNSYGFTLFTNNSTFVHTSGTVTASGITTATQLLSTSTYTMGASGPTLNLTGATPLTKAGLGISTFTFNGAGSTVEYSGASNVTFLDSPTAYVNLIISGGAGVVKTLAANTTVSGALTIRAASTLNLSNRTLGTPASVILETVGGGNGASITGTGQLTLGGNVTADYSGAGAITTGASITTPVALGGAPRTFTVADDGSSSTDFTITGIISGVGASTFIKNGTGTLTISGTNSYTVATNINAGTLQLGNTNTLNTGTPVTLNGGTLQTGATTGFSDAVGTLALTDNSIIALGTGVHALTFDASSGISWTTGRLLVVTGWTGGYNSTTGTAGNIFVGTNASGLSADQLSQIRFFNGSAYHHATQLSTGEVVPTNVAYSTFISAITGSWNTPATWGYSGTPTIGLNYPGTIDNAVISTGDAVDINQNPTSPAICTDLTINSGATLTIAAGKALTVNGTLTNNAGNTALVIESNATGTGSLIHSTANVKATIERYIGGWTDASHGWHFLSCPSITEAIQTHFVPDPPGSNQDFYKWDEPTDSWINTKTAAGDWNSSFESSLVSGRGYLVAYNANVTKSFRDSINVAGVSVSGLTHTDGNTYMGWHFLGNPFASALKWTQGTWNMTNIGTYPQIWNEPTASYKVLAGSGIIPAMSGFMVYTSGSGSLTIPADARVHSDSAWYKSGNEERILLVANDPEGKTAQESIIRFNSSATEDFDMN
jgi:autotransporter-associated beta strand protein